MFCKAKESLPRKQRKRISLRKLTQAEARDLHEVSEATGFSQNEVLDIYNEFNSMLEMHDSSLGVSRLHFVEKTKILNNPYSEELAGLIFEAIPKSNQGYLSFKEFICYLHLLYYGTPEEKLEFSFKIMKNGDKDYVTKDDLKRILTILLNIQSNLSGEQGPTDIYISQVVEYILEQFDDNKNGIIDWLEFKNTSSKNLDLFGVFQLVGGEALKSKFLKKIDDNDMKDIMSLLSKIRAEFKNLCTRVSIQDTNHLTINFEPNAPETIFQSQLM